jgi:hypothetical protein
MGGSAPFWNKENFYETQKKEGRNWVEVKRCAPDGNPERNAIAASSTQQTIRDYV